MFFCCGGRLFSVTLQSVWTALSESLSESPSEGPSESPSESPTHIGPCEFLDREFLAVNFWFLPTWIFTHNFRNCGWIFECEFSVWIFTSELLRASPYRPRPLNAPRCRGFSCIIWGPRPCLARGTSFVPRLRTNRQLVHHYSGINSVFFPVPCCFSPIC